MFTYVLPNDSSSLVSDQDEVRQGPQLLEIWRIHNGVHRNFHGLRGFKQRAMWTEYSCGTHVTV